MKPPTVSFSPHFLAVFMCRQPVSTHITYRCGCTLFSVFIKYLFQSKRRRRRRRYRLLYFVHKLRGARIWYFNFTVDVPRVVGGLALAQNPPHINCCYIKNPSFECESTANEKRLINLICCLILMLRATKKE